jgi:hypothetical protein
MAHAIVDQRRRLHVEHHEIGVETLLDLARDLDELRADCVKAMVKYLKAGVNIQKPIGSLSQRELEGLADACTSRWIVRVSERHAAGDAAVAEAADLLLFVV